MGSRRRSRNQSATALVPRVPVVILVILAASLTMTSLACERRLDVGHDRESDGDGTKAATDGVGPDESNPSEAGPTDASAADSSCAAICQKLLACGYTDASAMTKCNAECAVTPRSFLDCIAASTCQTLLACGPSFPVFAPPDSGSSGSSATCKYACDDIKFFGCISAAEHANCRTLCDTKPEDVLQTFIQCKEATSTCPERIDCYDEFAK
ncbi:hypothetical protein AKJ09_06612 [Labilithrix luteola]|uniref:Uncharacterized protein n=1 Tax=Labilithrix luteola TaxID=1391654 RepID=A0A0K1Q2F4_9BACT|nr:hypothetical protein [Labilithrix luteola]AKU99948.1 hypothetical protein AKJ09_06612 [Labilithrix luteola]